MPFRSSPKGRSRTTRCWMRSRRPAPLRARQPLAIDELAQTNHVASTQTAFNAGVARLRGSLETVHYLTPGAHQHNIRIAILLQSGRGLSEYLTGPWSLLGIRQSRYISIPSLPCAS
jgi:hypothetical protein